MVLREMKQRSLTLIEATLELFQALAHVRTNPLWSSGRPRSRGRPLERWGGLLMLVRARRRRRRGLRINATRVHGVVRAATLVVASSRRLGWGPDKCRRALREGRLPALPTEVVVEANRADEGGGVASPTAPRFVVWPSRPRLGACARALQTTPRTSLASPEKPKAKPDASAASGDQGSSKAAKTPVCSPISVGHPCAISPRLRPSEGRTVTTEGVRVGSPRGTRMERRPTPSTSTARRAHPSPPSCRWGSAASCGVGCRCRSSTTWEW